MVSGDWNTGPFGFAARNWSHPHEVPTNPHTCSPSGLHGFGCCRGTDVSRRGIVAIPAPALLRPGRRYVVGGSISRRRALSPRNPIPERPTCPRRRTAFWLWPAPIPIRALLHRHSRTWSPTSTHTSRRTGPTGPGQLALLILDAHALGVDPTSFGGTNLVTRLLATEETSGKNAGLFGTKSQVNNFQAGVYDQGLALGALAGTGDTKGSAIKSAESWLLNQQCADGGWTSYESKNNPCNGSPADFEGPDTNSTALAIEGLAAQGDLSGAADTNAHAFLVHAGKTVTAAGATTRTQRRHQGRRTPTRRRSSSRRSSPSATHRRRRRSRRTPIPSQCWSRFRPHRVPTKGRSPSLVSAVRTFSPPTKRCRQSRAWSSPSTSS